MPKVAADAGKPADGGSGAGKLGLIGFDGVGSTEVGAAGVGKATTGAVVTSIILIFTANFFMSLIFFGSSNQ